MPRRAGDILARLERAEIEQISLGELVACPERGQLGVSGRCETGITGVVGDRDPFGGDAQVLDDFAFRMLRNSKQLGCVLGRPPDRPLGVHPVDAAECLREQNRADVVDRYH